MTPALIRDVPSEANGLVVLAAGSRQSPARIHVEQVGIEAIRLLGERRRREGVESFPSYAHPAFASGPGRSGGEAVAEVRARGWGRIAVVSYFIAPGLLHDKAIDSAREAGAEPVGGPLGAAPELLEVIAKRAAEAERR